MAVLTSGDGLQPRDRSDKSGTGLRLKTPPQVGNLPHNGNRYQLRAGGHRLPCTLLILFPLLRNPGWMDRPVPASKQSRTDPIDPREPCRAGRRAGGLRGGRTCLGRTGPQVRRLGWGWAGSSCVLPGGAGGWRGPCGSRGYGGRRHGRAGAGPWRCRPVHGSRGRCGRPRGCGRGAGLRLPGRVGGGADRG